jgi:N-acetylglucosaminyldiphosphoundecaprenol N-acetyl-beta-D-mannosaminyltransferase
MSAPGEHRVLGVRVDPLTMADAMSTLDDMVATRNRGYLVFCTVSSVLSALENPSVAEAIEDAALVTPDGMPLVWITRRRATKPVERVYGPDFMRVVLESRDGLRHFFYGGMPGVADRVAQLVRERYPGAEVVGSYAPPMDLEVGKADTDAIGVINEARPDVVWIGLGHPKQELWAKAMQVHLEAPVLAPVGAAFDFLAGTKKEAPVWMKRAGLQWLHRLASEPRRLAKRYVVGNSKFVWLLARERLRGTR